MACEGNIMSDERIGEALIKEVIEEELNKVSEEVPPLTPLPVQNKQEQKVVTQLATMIRIVGDKVKNDKEFHDAIDGFSRGGGSKLDRFKMVVDKVMEGGISWEKIAVLFYVAGKLAVKMVEDHLPQCVKDILNWTVDFFKKYLLSWIVEKGGWLNSFADLAEASMDTVSPTHCYAFLIMFIAGVTFGSLITWRLLPRH
uniref:Bcl-2 Bcl-2 homology region 1-3 domain-containing protein n=1 Tax=Gouania willdenowi TaxID=441366 RepID=A0A8C5EQ13_GOUWI